MKFLKIRLWAYPVVLVSLALNGCGSGSSWDPSSVKGAFAVIESAVDDVTAQLSETKKKKGGMRDLGSDRDRIGFNLSIFLKAAEGTPVFDDAKDFEKKFIALETLISTRAPGPQVQAALKEVQTSVAAIKAKL